MGETIAIFGAVPARAAGDTRLSGLHMKLLTAIAAHDRLSDPRGKGQGCWAGNKRLAQMIGCNYTNLSTALTELADWGYIERRVNPLNKTRRIFYVVYDARDAALIGARTDGDSLPSGKPTAGIVCPDFRKSAQNQAVGSGEYIPQKCGTDSAEAGKKYPAEAAPPDGAAGVAMSDGELPSGQRPAGRRLRQIEAQLKAMSGRDPTGDEFDALVRAQHECWDVEDRHEGERIGYWAQRLADEIGEVTEC